MSNPGGVTKHDSTVVELGGKKNTAVTFTTVSFSVYYRT